MPKILLAPGSGDIHWVMLKMESIIERKFGGEKPEIWVWSQSKSTDRSEDYVRRIPFVEWGGYFRAEAHRSMGDQVFTRGAPYAVDNWEGFDLFVAFNAPLGQGILLPNIFANYQINWNYEIKLTAEDYRYGASLRADVGDYIGVSFYTKGFYKKWTDEFTIEKIHTLLRCLREKGKVVLTGSPWDASFMRQFNHTDHLDLVGQTSMGNFLGLLNHAKAFVCFAAGNGMLAQHLHTKTFMFWHPRHWTPEFMTNWVDPERLSDHTYVPLDVRGPCISTIMEHL